jgi:glucose/arabinose dehydrogenase
MERLLMRMFASVGVVAVVAAALAVQMGQTTTSTQSLSASSSLDRLPDLDQEPPRQLALKVFPSTSGPSYHLGFRSAVRNVGVGPLIVDGTRSSSSASQMRVDQVIQRRGAPPRTVVGVGSMEYAVSHDHQHWHYLNFERYAMQKYELRSVADGHVVQTSRKSGFCLGDRYRVTTLAMPGASASPTFTGKCGLRQPGLLRMHVGISVGYGDAYAAFLEGQDLPLDGLPDGRYVLVHRVNTDHRLREISYANNAASVLLDLRWRGSKPDIQVLQTCPDTSRCGRPVQVRTVATGLEIPWDIAFMPNGSALVTERPGRVRLLDRRGQLQTAPVAEITVSKQGEGGLLGLAVDPQFAANRFVYVYYTGRDGMRLERWLWTGNRLVRDATLVDAIAAGKIHDSGRIAFGPDGRLYVATGDAGHPEVAQDERSLNGKFLPLTSEQAHRYGPVQPTVLASGLRNPQGFDWQPRTGALIANDHGPTGFDGPEGYDEVNQIQPGGNYGWPVAIGGQTAAGRFVAPLRVYRDPIAPSGGAFVRRPGSLWTGDYVLAALRGESLIRLRIADGRVVEEEPLLQGRFGRLRTVRQGPDGCLYVLTSNRDGRGRVRPGDDRILCVTPPRR